MKIVSLTLLLLAGLLFGSSPAHAASTMSGYPKCADAKVGQRCEIGGGIVLTKGGAAVPPPKTYGGFIGYVTLSKFATNQVGYGDLGVLASWTCKKTLATFASCLLGANRYAGSIAASARKATAAGKCLRVGVFQAGPIPIPTNWYPVAC